MLKWKFDWKSFFLVSGITLGSCLVTGALFALFFDLRMRDTFVAMIALYGVGGFIAAILEGVSEKMRDKNYAFGFGAAIHYGAAVICFALWDIEDVDANPWKYVVALGIAGAIAWIAWEKYFKDI